MTKHCLPLRFILLTALSIVAALPSNAHGQSSEEGRPRKFAAIMADERAIVVQAFASDPDRRIALGGISFPSYPSIVYMDSLRAIAPERKDLIRRWITSYGIDDQTPEMYESEMLIGEDGLELWLPVQNELIPHLETRLERGDSVTLFAVWVGALGSPANIDWVFIVYGFRDR